MVVTLFALKKIITTKFGGGGSGGGGSGRGGGSGGAALLESCRKGCGDGGECDEAEGFGGGCRLILYYFFYIKLINFYS